MHFFLCLSVLNIFQRAMTTASAAADGARESYHMVGSAAQISSPTMIMLLRDDAHLTDSFGASIDALLKSDVCAAHLYTADRGGVLIIGRRRDAKEGTSIDSSSIQTSSSIVSEKDGTSKCNDHPALVAATAIVENVSGRQRSTGGDEDEKDCFTEPLELYPERQSNTTNDVLGAIFHFTTFEHVLSYLDASRVEEKEDTNIIDGIIRVLMLDGFIVREATHSILSVLDD